MMSLFYFYSPLTSCKKSEKFIVVSEKTALHTNQPSNQLLPTISTLKDLVDAGPTTNFNKNGMESKMENLTDNFRETNFVFQLI